MGKTKTYQRLPQREMDIAVQDLLQHFQEDCNNGKFHVGEMLPSPRKLAEMYQVTFSTARNLYTKLLQKGLIQTLPRKGTVLCSLPEPETWGRKDLIRNGIAVIGLLDCVNPNAMLNHTTLQLLAIDDLCNQNKIPVHFYNLNRDLSKPLSEDSMSITADDIKALKKKHVSGFIALMTYQMNAHENIKMLKKLNAPVVCVNSRQAGMCSVICDELKSGEIATNHLIGLKHKKIAFLGFDYPGVWQDERIIGYRNIMEKNGLRPIEKWSHFFPYISTRTIEYDCADSVAGEAEEIFRSCTAAVCTSDGLACLFVKYAKEHGLKAPALISFDNYWNYRSWDLSSIRNPTAEMAMKAFQLIQLAIKGEEVEGKLFRVPGVLYKRQSSYKNLDFSENE